MNTYWESSIRRTKYRKEIGKVEAYNNYVRVHLTGEGEVNEGKVWPTWSFVQCRQLWEITKILLIGSQLYKIQKTTDCSREVVQKRQDTVTSSNNIN